MMPSGRDDRRHRVAGERADQHQELADERRSPGSASEARPATRKTPASTGATFCTPPKSAISREPRRADQEADDQEQRGRSRGRG